MESASNFCEKLLLATFPATQTTVWRDSPTRPKLRGLQIYRRRPPRRLSRPCLTLLREFDSMTQAAFGDPLHVRKDIISLSDTLYLEHTHGRSGQCSAFHLFDGGDLRDWHASSRRSFRTRRYSADDGVIRGRRKSASAHDRVRIRSTFHAGGSTERQHIPRRQFHGAPARTAVTLSN